MRPATQSGRRRACGNTLVRRPPFVVRRESSESGMTLLELILVLVILSTVLAMAAPSLRGFFDSRRTEDTAAQILALTQWARSQAISEGVTYRLNFNTAKRIYWLTAQQAGTFEELRTELGQAFELPKDIALELIDPEREDQDVFFTFTPHGTVTPGTIRLIDLRGQTIDLKCPSATESFAIEKDKRKTYARYGSR